jgi:dienelactone hydrolase
MLGRNAGKALIGFAVGAVSLLGLVVAASAFLAAYARVRGDLPLPSGRHAVVQRHISVPSLAGPLRLYVSFPAGAARKEVPLILFAPGWGGEADGIPLLLAEFASHGYFIAAFDDIAHDPRQKFETEAEYADRTARHDYSNDERYRKLMLAGERRLVWEVARARLVLDTVIDAGRRDEAPFRALDPARVGFVGFSFGGAVAVETARFDARVRAAVNLDGSPFGESARQGVKLPYLLISSSQSFPRSKDLLSARDSVRINAEWSRADQAIHAQSLGKPGFRWFEVQRSRHMDLTDALFHAGLRDALRLSWDDRLRMRRAVAQAVLDFLAWQVKGEVARDAPQAIDSTILRVVTRPGPP